MRPNYVDISHHTYHGPSHPLQYYQEKEMQAFDKKKKVRIKTKKDEITPYGESLSDQRGKKKKKDTHTYIYDILTSTPHHQLLLKYSFIRNVAIETFRLRTSSYMYYISTCLRVV